MENGIMTVGEVLECYPRLHRDCQLEFCDEGYSTLIGTIVKHNLYVTPSGMSVLTLDFEVNPLELARLRGDSATAGRESINVPSPPALRLLALKECSQTSPPSALKSHHGKRI